ncbi:uncharacterized protein A4U43_C02F20390 [Asparagus officinalis]|uniref:DYW domain-containing protein n=1 Tax=Asparagus officinalis TaxID=4686 RepID=A0A5P1FJY9_ASPOF|nr:uncharacterized protein A4U43_C02F20390 [Asparagus officinalis]
MSFSIKRTKPISPQTSTLLHLLLPRSSLSSSALSQSNPNLYHHYSSILQSLTTLKPPSSSSIKQLHARLLLSGFGSDTHLGTKLINLYSTTHNLHYALQLFDKIPKRNLFVWNILIRAYAWHGPYQTAIDLYNGLIDYGLVPDNFTFPFVLKACSALSALETGRAVHDMAIRTRWVSDVFVGAGLIDMYAKCGCVDDARIVFDGVSGRDVVVWNSMIGAYSQNGRPLEALVLFREMVGDGFRPTVATLVTVVSAVADSSNLKRGREIHGFSWRRGFGGNDNVKTSLVDMYAKSGWVKAARDVFEKLAEKKIVSWNAMICGLAMHGHADEALDLFDEMKEEGRVIPDHITFVGVLSACSNGGLLEEGRKLFDLLVSSYSIEPTVQHYTCMIDLLGHSGELEEAYELIQRMPMRPDAGVWGALLNACKIHRNVELGEVALEKLIELEPNDAGNYVLLSNIYAQVGKWEGAAKVRKLMTERGLKKDIACSWIEVKNKVYAFLVGDQSHPCSEEIYRELDRLEGLMEEAGYVVDTVPVFHDVDDDEKKNMVRVHSERLAIAFGIISTPPGTKLLVTKNLRVCEDCHGAIKFMSKIVEREIIIRDVNRYHHFKDV